MSGTLTIGQKTIERLLAQQIDHHLSELLPALAAKYVAHRCSRLTLEEAMKHLGCRTRSTLLAVCRARRIPIIRESQKRQFILIADLRAADARDKQVPAGTTTLGAETDAPPST